MELGIGTRSLVIGLGTSGLAAIRFLHGLGHTVLVTEFRHEDQIDKDVLAVVQALGIALETGGHSRKFFEKAQMIVTSPGVPQDLPLIEQARARGVPVVGELALAAGRISCPVIGVTGSNGKTTVTSLIGHLLKADNRKVFVGGNIGTPVLAYFGGSMDEHVLVLELSSFQLETGGEFRPDIGLLLNLTPDHIDRHGTMQDYAAAKRRIFAHQTSGDVAIVGKDDPLVMQEKVGASGRVYGFGTDPSSQAVVEENGVRIRGTVTGHGQDEMYDLSATVLSSFVNRLNAAAAILAARVFGSAPEAIRKGLASYVAPAHRMALVAEIESVKYVNDSKGTNVGAVAAALASCGNRVVLIAGGRDKESDFSLLAEQVRKHVHHLILIGEAADSIEAELGSLVPVIRADSMSEAVSRASEVARPGDTVLLSPACASFDMYAGYAHRGDVFEQAVLNLQKSSRDDC